MINEDEEGILYRRTSYFTFEQREKMRRLVAAMRQQIREADDRFHFRKEERDAAREIVGTLALSWESLEETRTNKLAAYGQVDPGLNETLDPIVQRLIGQLFELQHVAHGIGPRQTGNKE
ncbi:MAG: hypothetical protein M1482_00075 [Chloroflexi bacterium]|nr:hypothetical protein [Chloroflexota bacterium]